MKSSQQDWTQNSFLHPRRVCKDSGGITRGFSFQLHCCWSTPAAVVGLPAGTPSEPLQAWTLSKTLTPS